LAHLQNTTLILRSLRYRIEPEPLPVIQPATKPLLKERLAALTLSRASNPSYQRPSSVQMMMNFAVPEQCLSVGGSGPGKTAASLPVFFDKNLLENITFIGQIGTAASISLYVHRLM
jgi:hypothetical protein